MVARFSNGVTVLYSVSSMPSSDTKIALYPVARALLLVSCIFMMGSGEMGLKVIPIFYVSGGLLHLLQLSAKILVLNTTLEALIKICPVEYTLFPADSVSNLIN